MREDRLPEMIRQTPRERDRVLGDSWVVVFASLICGSRACSLFSCQIPFPLVSSALAAGMGTTAVDVRHTLHGFALQAAVAAALGCKARTRRMFAFVRFCLSHIGLLLNDALVDVSHLVIRCSRSSPRASSKEGDKQSR